MLTAGLAGADYPLSAVICSEFVTLINLGDSADRS